MNIKNMLSQMMLLDSYGAVGLARMTTSERLASGLRINSAKDDASTIGVLSQVDAQLMEQRAFAQIAGDAGSFLATQEEALNSMGEILTRMLAIKKEADIAIGLGEDTSRLEEEYKTLQSEFVGITSEQFNGLSIFASGPANEVVEYATIDGARSFETTKYTPVDFKLGNTFKVGETYSVYSIINHGASRISWDAAKAEAESLGGHLAVITSQEENDALTAALGGNWGGWLGIHKPVGGAWTSVTGEVVTYTNWANPSWSGDSSKHNAAITRGDGSWNGTWLNTGDPKPAYVLEVENTYTLSDVSESDLDSNLQNLTQAIALNGAEQSRVTRVQSITETSIQNLGGIVARWEEADYAAESTKNTTQGILMESSLALLSQANIRSQSMLRLLYARIDKEWEFSSRANEEDSDRLGALRQSLIQADEEDSLRT